MLFSSDITAPKHEAKLGRFSLFNELTKEVSAASFATKAEAQEILDGWQFEDQPALREMTFIVEV